MINLITKPSKKRSEQKRYAWLDIIKALCIISVVIFHINYVSDTSLFNSIWLYFYNLSDLYKVTIFYCVAGITLNNEKLKNTFSFIKNKFKKLYLKTVVIGIIAVLLHNVFININFYKLGFSYSGKTMYMYTFKDYVVNVIKTLLLANREVILGAFWFASSLVICFIMLLLLEFIINNVKIIKKKREFRLFITFCLMFASILLSNCFNITIPRFSNSLVGLFLIDLTNYLFNHNIFEIRSIYLLISCLCIALFAPLFGGIAMNNNAITSPYFLLVVVMAFLYLLIYVSKILEKKDLFGILGYIGKNSFAIMAFHFIGFKFGSLLLNIIGYEVDISLLVPNVNSIVLVFYYLLFGVLISLLIGYISRKYLKFDL